MNSSNSASALVRVAHVSSPFTTPSNKYSLTGALLIAMSCLLTTYKTGATNLATPRLAECNQGQYQTVLSKTTLNTNTARAYWLSSDTIRWPGKEAQGHFYLYTSAAGAINIDIGAKLNGATQRIALQVGTGIRATQSDIQNRFTFTGSGAELRYTRSPAALKQLLKQQVILVQENDRGEVVDFTYLQIPGALDDLYLAANTVDDLGVNVNQDVVGRTARSKKSSAYSEFKLWAPTARQISVCLYHSGDSEASAIKTMKFAPDIGVWEARTEQDLSGHYYKYLLDVFIPGTGWVRNAVTDPYSISLTTDSKRSYIANLDSAALKPAGWDQHKVTQRVQHATDMSIYELHVRDFSANDLTVRPDYRGKYLAFTEQQSNGMKHLEALSKAGMTDIHLLPVFDIATIPEEHCRKPEVSGGPDSEQQQAIVTKNAATDCFNWGYDPFHYNAPEGSYATNAANGAIRILEFRKMVMALHQANLRVGMDVVYNHTAYAGQHEKSVLDRIVPGYYQRLNADGKVEESTCETCGNTATENNMMAKLLSDSVRLWARKYKIDSFRFDLMGHQPRPVMEKLKVSLASDNGHPIFLIGEGWNFGEVANNARFVQATQLSLNGSGIGTFSDRARDAIRGAGRGDDMNSIVNNKGYINGLAEGTTPQQVAQTLRAADMVRVGLAGTLSDFEIETALDGRHQLKEMNYNGQPAGYASEPDEVVNYVENHDNQTLFDINAFRLPVTTSHEDRARVQVLGLALTALSQGIAYFHAGSDILRSKSLDGNSYNSGDWFNRLDWTYQDNYFGTGLPPKQDNQALYPLMRPLLVNIDIKPRPQDIAFTRDAFHDLLSIRSSSSLFHLRHSSEIKKRLHFFNTGPSQNPRIIVGYLDGTDLPGANWKSVVYLVNVSQTEQQIKINELQHHQLQLHPVHLSTDAADQRIRKEAKFSPQDGFTIPARSAVVFVGDD